MPTKVALWGKISLEKLQLRKCKQYSTWIILSARSDKAKREPTIATRKQRDERSERLIETPVKPNRKSSRTYLYFYLATPLLRSRTSYNNLFMVHLLRVRPLKGAYVSCLAVRRLPASNNLAERPSFPKPKHQNIRPEIAAERPTAIAALMSLHV